MSQEKKSVKLNQRNDVMELTKDIVLIPTSEGYKYLNLKTGSEFELTGDECFLVPIGSSHYIEAVLKSQKNKK